MFIQVFVTHVRQINEQMFFETNHSKWSTISHGPVYCCSPQRVRNTDIHLSCAYLERITKISQIPMACDNECLVTFYVGKSGDEI